MSISFACPQCRAQVEVGDEFAGHAGQCPRCESVIAIPSATQPAPVPVMDEAPPPPPREAKPKPKPRPTRAEEPRRRRPPPEPAKPFGPIWPWVIGGFAALVFIGLLVSSLSVLVFWRHPAPTLKREDQPVGIKMERAAGPVVTVGRLEGKRAFMQDGVFQVRGAFNEGDAIDFTDGQAGARGRSQEFEIELRAKKDYVLEHQGQPFEGFLVVKDFQFNPVAKGGVRGVRSAQIILQPRATGVFRVTVTSFDPAVGEFTLTIRERGIPKPLGP